MLIVIAIMASLSVLPFLYFSNAKNGLVLHSIFESISDTVTTSQSAVLSQKMESVVFSFDITRPRIYLYQDNFLLTDTQKLSLATNFAISSFSDLPVTPNGSIELSWTAPNHGDFVVFQVHSPSVLLKEDPVAPAITANSPIVFTPLNASQNLSFKTMHPISHLSTSEIHLSFFSSENLSAQSQKPVLLNKIEVKDFLGNWMTVDKADVKVLSPLGKIKYYADGKEYLGVRVTLTKNVESQTMTF